MLTKYKKILIIALPLAFFLLVFALIFFAKEPEVEEPQDIDWSSENLTSLVKAGFKEYIKQDLSEPENEREERLQEYFTEDSPVFDYGPQEIIKMGADSSVGEIVESRDCHEQEGEDLCLIINTKIDYYKGTKKTNTTVVPYWITIDYDSSSSFQVYDLGVWDFDYNEDPI